VGRIIVKRTTGALACWALAGFPRRTPIEQEVFLARCGIQAEDRCEFAGMSDCLYNLCGQPSRHPPRLLMAKMATEICPKDAKSERPEARTGLCLLCGKKFVPGKEGSTGSSALGLCNECKPNPLHHRGGPPGLLEKKP